MRDRVTLLAGGWLIVAPAALLFDPPASPRQCPSVDLPRLMVANPHSFQPEDSAASVRVGDGFRQGIASISGKCYRAVDLSEMNGVLVKYALRHGRGASACCRRGAAPAARGQLRPGFGAHAPHQELLKRAVSAKSPGMRSRSSRPLLNDS